MMLNRCALWMTAALTAALLTGSSAAQTGARADISHITQGIQETVLPNGLKVITKEVKSAPVVAFQIWYRAGSRNEHTGITGVSHLLEHLQFKGTRKYRVGEISRSLFVNGALFNAGTSYDYTNYWQTLGSDRLDLAMSIEADRMRGSRIDAEDLASEMSVVRSELEGNENSPDSLLYHAVAAAAMQTHPYRWPVIGWRADVENMPRDLIYQYYRTHYGPNNAFIVAVGNFDTEELLKKIRRHFGGIARIPDPLKVYTAEPPQRGEKRITIRRTGSLPLVNISFKSPEGKSPDFYALDALATILATGRTSRLYQALVEQQIASQISAGAPTMIDPFLFTFSAAAAPGVTAERLESALDAEIERVKETGVTEEELKRAVTLIETSHILGSDSVTDLAQQIGYWEIVDSWNYLSTYVPRIRALKPEDLQRVARKYFIRDSRTTGLFIPSGEPAPPAGPPRELSARVDPPKQGDRPVAIPKPASIPAVTKDLVRFTLPNGARVVFKPNPAAPTFALTGSLNAGSVLEPEDRPGLAGLTAAMLSRGTTERSAFEFAQALESMGASLSASAQDVTANFSGQALSRNFDEVMELLGEMLRKPAFPAEQLQRLKAQVLAGLEQERTDPEARAGRAFLRSTYPSGHPLRPQTLEEEIAALRAMTVEDLRGFYRRQYGPESIILVVAGDLTEQQVRQAAQKALGDWPRSTTAKPLPELKLELRAGAERQVINIPDRSEASIIFGHAGGVDRDDPDFYAVQVMNMILGGGGALNSRLGNIIRDQQGLAYDVFSFFDAGRYPGPFQVQIGTNPANAARAVESLKAEIARLREAGVSAREVQEAISYLTGRHPGRLETNSGLAQQLWVGEFYGLGPEYLDKYVDLYRAVTVDQVNRAARERLHPDRASLILSGSLPGA